MTSDDKFYTVLFLGVCVIFIALYVSVIVDGYYRRAQQIECMKACVANENCVELCLENMGGK